jgi:hypothetical protein
MRLDPLTARLAAGRGQGTQALGRADRDPPPRRFVNDSDGSMMPHGPFGTGGIASPNLSNEGGSNLASLSPSRSIVGGDSSPIPEPSTLLLVLLALSVMIGQRISLRRPARNKY